MPRKKGRAKTSAQRQEIFMAKMKAEGLRRTVIFIPEGHVARVREFVKDIRSSPDDGEFIKGYRQCKRDIDRLNSKMFIP